MTGPQQPHGDTPQQPQPPQGRPLPKAGWYRHPRTRKTMYWTGTGWAATQPGQSSPIQAKA